MAHYLPILALFVFAISGVLAVDDCVPTGDCLTVAEAAQCNGLTTFLDAVEIAGLTEVVNDPDAQLTIFAPTNGAFEAILGNLGLSVEYLQFDLTFTSQVLKYHVLPTPETKESLLKKKELSTVLGQNKLCGLPSDLKFKKNGGSVKVVGIGSSAEVIEEDTQACGSVVHVVDYVLLPCPMQLAG